MTEEPFTISPGVAPPPPPPPPPPPALPPRAMTPAVRRRAWADPRVRFWLGASAALFVAAAYLLITQYLAWRQDCQLVQSGTPIDATVIQANDMVLPNKRVAGDRPVRLRFDWAGQAHEVAATSLAGRSENDWLYVGQTIPIRIDPAHPDRWTPRTETPPLARELIGGGIALAVALGLLAVALAVRSGALRTWRTARAVPALVASARHTALAPRAWAVQCTPVEEGDNRLFDVYLPAGAEVAEGAPMVLLMPERRGRAMSAAWFD